jgi:predicted nucleic acid-binding protein
VAEEGSGEVDKILLDAAEVGLCILCLPEVVSALARRRREGLLTAQQYREARVRLADEVRDSTVLDLTPSVIAETVALLDANALRAADALHVACAIDWRADLFVTSDRQQVEAARRAGLKVKLVG